MAEMADRGHLGDLSSLKNIQISHPEIEIVFFYVIN